MLTKKQIKWASLHDWFVCDNGDGTIIVMNEYDNRIEELFDGDFEALRIWAGY